MRLPGGVRAVCLRVCGGTSTRINRAPTALGLSPRVRRHPERGGVSPSEAVALAEGRRWEPMEREEALEALVEI